MATILLTGLTSVLKAFDRNGWKGSFVSGEWKISNGGYDLWFELYYSGNVVAQCVDGRLISNFGLSDMEKTRMFNKILEIYERLCVDV